MDCSRYWMTIGAAMAGLAVAFGAFGAHGFDDYLAGKYAGQTRTVTGEDVPAAAKYMADYNTGVRYHMWHALGLLAVGIVARTKPTRALNFAGWCFLAGIALFSGSLYIITLIDVLWLGVPGGLVAACGGTSFLIGWISFAVAVCPCNEPNSASEHESQ